MIPHTAAKIIVDFARENVQTSDIQFYCRSCGKWYPIRAGKGTYTFEVDSTGSWTIPQGIIDHMYKEHEDIATLAALGGFNEHTRESSRRSMF